MKISSSVLWKAKDHPVLNRIIFIIKVAFVIFLLGLIYYPILIWMWQRWFAADSYYEHGPLIPIVSLVLIWLKRRELSSISIQSSKLGIWIIIFGLLLHIASALTRIYFISAYSLFIVIIGIIVYFFGKKLTFTILFPLCFLLFMVPAPVAIIESTTLKMKLLTAHASVFIIQLLGTPVIREGSTVYMPNTSVVVDDPCSGLKSLISLSALGILFAYIVRASYPRKVVLFLLSIPIALLANMIRTTATLLIANLYGNKIITDGLLHKGFGLMVFVIAFAGLFLAGRLLKCRISQDDT